MGVSKHRQAGHGKKTRVRAGSHLAAPVLNRDAAEACRLRKRRSAPMYATMRELMQSR